MHCRVCDKMLSDAEATHFNERTQEYDDLCTKDRRAIEADLHIKEPQAPDEQEDDFAEERNYEDGEFDSTSTEEC